jgi:hypothetical protein
MEVAETVVLASLAPAAADTAECRNCEVGYARGNDLTRAVAVPTRP